MSVRKKSSGGVGTPTSSHEAPQVLYMLTGATLAAFPSKALCITAKACQMPELQASMKTHIRPSPWLHESLCMSVKSFKPLSLQTSDTLLQKRSRALS